MSKSLFTALYVAAFLTFTSACISPPGNQGKEEQPPAEVKSTSPQEEEVSAPVAAGIQTVDLYLETSGSMGGYLKGATEFKKNVAELVATLKKNKDRGRLRSVSYYLIPEDTTLKVVPNEASFFSQLQNERLAQGRNSLITDIFKMLSHRHAPGKVNIFISDCILSDLDVKNVDVKENEIAALFSPMAVSGQGAMIYAFKSAFNHRQGNIKNRPFYIWFFGPAGALRLMEDLLSEENFFPVEQLTFGFRHNPSTEHIIAYTHLPGAKDYKVTPGDFKAITEMSLAKNPQYFDLGLNLSTLPPRFTDIGYLNQHLQLKGNGLEAELLGVKPAADVLPSIKGTSATQYRPFTHFAGIKIKKLYAKQATLSLLLPDRNKDWYKDWSTMEDKTKIREDEKTFAFQYLIQGIAKSFSKVQAEQLHLHVQVPVSAK